MIQKLLSDDEPDAATGSKSSSTPRSTVLSLFGSPDEYGDESATDSPIIQAEPESMAETVRRSGLAYSAGIALFAAVVFMLVLGWGADVLLGTSPWGIVGGIILGSVIGFIQFFRLTSQIFKK
ncbi:MAG: AtpZ/AtpI family protein [Acidobacteriota bacterium]